MNDPIKVAVLAERERCANIAASCARGAAIEINGETHLLGIMTNDPASSQYATACAIMAAIDCGSDEDPTVTDNLFDTGEKKDVGNG